MFEALGVAANAIPFPAAPDVARTLSSDSGYLTSLTLSVSPCKHYGSFERRDGRVAEGARLEITPAPDSRLRQNKLF
jgi:hypothetical protein